MKNKIWKFIAQTLDEKKTTIIEEATQPGVLKRIVEVLGITHDLYPLLVEEVKNKIDALYQIVETQPENEKSEEKCKLMNVYWNIASQDLSMQTDMDPSDSSQVAMAYITTMRLLENHEPAERTVYRVAEKFFSMDVESLMMGAIWERLDESEPFVIEKIYNEVLPFTYSAALDKIAVIRKCKAGDSEEGKPWCLYTHDGSKLLGRHPSKESARKQESAIKAQGRLQKVVEELQ